MESRLSIRVSKHYFHVKNDSLDATDFFFGVYVIFTLTSSNNMILLDYSNFDFILKIV